MPDLLHLFPNQDLSNTLFTIFIVIPFVVVLLLLAGSWVWGVLFGRPVGGYVNREHDVRNCPLCGGGWIDQCSEYQASYGDSEDTLP